MSGVANIAITLTNGAKSFPVGPWLDVDRPCAAATVLANGSCVDSGNPISCCTGVGAGNCQTLPTCNSGSAGLCRRATDCTSSDNCSAVGGSTIETLVCDGSTWQVKSTVANPTTTCMERIHVLPRYAPGGTYSISGFACDALGNCSSLVSGGSIVNTP